MRGVLRFTGGGGLVWERLWGEVEVGGKEGGDVVGDTIVACKKGGGCEEFEDED